MSTVSSEQKPGRYTGQFRSSRGNAISITEPPGGTLSLRMRVRAQAPTADKEGRQVAPRKPHLPRFHLR